MKVPFLNLELLHAQIQSELAEAVQRVMRSNRFVLGPEVRAFEKEFADWSDCPRCVGNSNGLDALTLSLQTIGIGGPADEVVIPANTFVATALAVSRTGATPVLVDVDPNTHLMAPNELKKAMGPNVKAVVPVHLFGQACSMREIVAIAAKSGAYVIEDNAQAQGATWEGRQTGSWGHLGATSFYPGKNLGAFGDAGAVTMSDPRLESTIRELGNYGSKEKYIHESKGYNMRLDELQAALLRVKLSKLTIWNNLRVEAASRYEDLLSDIQDLRLPSTNKNATHVYHLYVVQTNRRDELAKWLSQRGVDTLVHYPKCIHEHQAYHELLDLQGSFPVAEHLARTMLSLPMHPFLSEEEQKYIATSIRAFFKR